ncbi:MAG: hypothetical protein NZ869_01215 [Thermoanaerobaculum sp.]|nr:hypothetical protein [Thermoanaerobaculum sp.]MDW7968763.1 hypothetical protein [Thermoanaerobaculum sp.]
MKQQWAWVLLVAGVVLFLLGLLADPLGVGAAPGLGWKQGLLALVGVALAVYGGLSLRKSKA